MTPEVSVVLTTFNGAARGYLHAAIDSVIAQSYTAYELLLVDDGSTDSTQAVCESYLSDSRVRYLRQVNAGVAAARNRGLEQARADFVCFLDDDDSWDAEKLDRQMKVLGESEFPLNLVYTAIKVVNKDDTLLNIQRHAVPADPYEGMFFENFVDATSSVLVRKSVALEVGGFAANVFTPQLQGCEDRDLWIRIARVGGVTGMADPLVTYRIHGQKLSGNIEQMERSELAMLSRAFRDAPPAIIARRNDIYAATYGRLAMEYFGAGDYAGFRAMVRKIFALGRVKKASFGLAARYLLSCVPGIIPLIRKTRR